MLGCDRRRASSGVTWITSKGRDQGSGLCRLTVRHGVSYGTFLTASEQSRWLCIWQRTLLSPGRRNTAREFNGDGGF